jgi:endo-1,3(4)-beta-glucanase
VSGTAAGRPGRRRRPRRVGLIGLVAAAIALPLVGVLAVRPDGTSPIVTGEQVGAVHQAELATLDLSRLAPGVLPPTNRWFTALALGGEPRPVYPRPVSVALARDGFSLDVPPVTTRADAISATHRGTLQVPLGTDGSRVTAYDDASVTVELHDADGAAVAGLVLAQGSPLVSLTAATDLTVPLARMSVRDGSVDGTAVGTLDRAGRTWAVVAPEEALLAGRAPALTLGPGAWAVWFPYPDDPSSDAVELLERAAAAGITGVTADHTLTDTAAVTTLRYATRTGGQTMHVTMPHHRHGEQPERAGCGHGTYPSPYGTLELCAGSELVSWAPRLEPTGALDLDGVAPDRLEVVADRLAKDVAATTDVPADTYFGGKALHRAATLVVLGEQIGRDRDVRALRAQVSRELRTWAEPEGCARRDERCFAYDPTARGVIGLRTGFGSEEFNDHHFHHGYHLGAAGMLAAGDPALAERLRPVMDLLAQDIAAPEQSPWFPRLRVFDRYAGHSWASGTSPFENGNNQESVAEAINAWNGLGLWARATEQEELLDVARWLLSTEVAARLYWTDLDLDDPVYHGYDHTVVGINWGARRDWATFFSDHPSAMLGIQLLPMAPADLHRSTSPERIRASVEEASRDGFEVQFGDYLLMYLALAGPEDADRAWSVALDQQSIDDGSSRAYLLAWIAAHAGR